MAPAPSLEESRQEREFPESAATSSGRSLRGAFARDRDRILHSSALRRLAAVTQVVDPAEGHIFHNRLTHTLKVAQIGRRLAEKLVLEQPDLVNEVGGLDPEAVEAAALAHDLGHPPFGHIAEKKLNHLLKAGGRAGERVLVEDGYEGNAQSFRIVTKLCARSEEHVGLNLTRATLNALLKYPWMRPPAGIKKWGAYASTEGDQFRFVRRFDASTQKSAEAELMDWSDDITYAVHDLEDFYRAGLVPLDRLTVYEAERHRWVDEVFEHRKEEELGMALERFREVADRVFNTLSTLQPYSGGYADRVSLRETTSSLINKYVQAIRLAAPGDNGGRRVNINQEALDDVVMLKELTWHYVIKNPALASQQHGKERLIGDLYDIYMDASTSKRWKSVLPVRCSEAIDDGTPDDYRARVIVDAISSLSDREAIQLHGRLTGIRTGSLLDPLPL